LKFGFLMFGPISNLYFQKDVTFDFSHNYISNNENYGGILSVITDYNNNLYFTKANSVP